MRRSLQGSGWSKAVWMTTSLWLVSTPAFARGPGFEVEQMSHPSNRAPGVWVPIEEFHRLDKLDRSQVLTLQIADARAAESSALRLATNLVTRTATNAVVELERCHASRAALFTRLEVCLRQPAGDPLWARTLQVAGGAAICGFSVWLSSQ